MNYSKYDAVLPTRHSNKTPIKGRVIGIIGLGVFVLILIFGWRVVPTENLQIFAIFIIISLFTAPGIIYRLVKPVRCKICNLPGIGQSTKYYCRDCKLVVSQFLQSHKGPIICRKCKYEVSNYDYFLSHFRDVHNNGYGGEGTSFYAEDNAIRKIV